MPKNQYLYWELSAHRRYLPLLTVAFGVVCLYCYQLNGVGVLGPDEPRYAAIGRAMAQTGQLITPKLWGNPWFEKPPLLYWFTAIGTWTGLDPDLAARVPVALLSLCFLAAFFFLLRSEFGFDAAAVSTILLASCASWVTYSSLCLTDLPLAVFFSLAVLLTVPLTAKTPPETHVQLRFAAIGACIGLAMLSKGLVPIALAAPFLWYLRRLWRSWWIAALAAILVAAPWYLAVYAENGYPFIEEFFIKHHLERLYSPALQHVQPWYYYVPVLLAGLFPWTPLLALLAVKGKPWDARRRFLAAIVLWGVLFFSISLNKLPGYLLPLIPALFALIAAHFDAENPALPRAWLLPCAILIAAIPLLAQILPQALAAGRLTSLTLQGLSPTQIFYVVLPLAALLVVRRSWAASVLVLCVVAGGIYLKSAVYPILDRTVSARDLWRELRPNSADICDDWMSRDWAYGLAFYRGSPFPPCSARHARLQLRSPRHGPPVLEPNP